MAITSAGIGSGLDIEALITGLVQADAQASVLSIDRKEADTNISITGFGLLKNGVSGLKASVDGLKDAASFENISSSSADNSIFTVSSDSDAVAGKFGIEVTQLAEADKRRSEFFTASTSVVGTGALTITSGAESFEVTVDSSNQTLAGIRDAINNDTDNNIVDVTILTTSAGSSLIFTAKNTGLANAVSVAGTNTLENFADKITDSKQLASATFATAATDIGAVDGELTITIGSTTSDAITITDGGNDNLEAIRDAINAETSINSLVTASIVNVENGVQLVITANDPSAEETISVAGTSTLASGFTDNFSSGSFVLEAAADATILLDGETVTSESNLFSGVLTGVNVTVNKVSTSGEETSLSLVEDSSAIKSLIGNFVATHNSFISGISDLTSFNKATGQGGILIGDPLARGVSSQLRKITSSEFTDNTNIQSLVDMGITLNSDGDLEIDNDKLDTILETDFDEVKSFFSKASVGIAVQINTVTDNFVKTDGVIDEKLDSLGEVIDDVTDQRTALSERLTNLEARLRDSMVNMDLVVARLRSQADAFQLQFDSITNNGNDN